MIKNDEILLYAALRARSKPRPSGVRSYGTRAVVIEECERLGIHPNRAFFLLQKWNGKGYMDYGMWAWSSWFTPEAPISLGEIKPDPPMKVLRDLDPIGNF